MRVKVPFYARDPLVAEALRLQEEGDHDGARAIAVQMRAARDREEETIPSPPSLVAMIRGDAQPDFKAAEVGSSVAVAEKDGVPAPPNLVALIRSNQGARR